MQRTALVALAFATGCAIEPTTLEVPSASAQVFQERVYPVLLADCAFTACHGNKDRFFSVFGPGRARLDPTTDIFAPATPGELAHSFTRAESMLVGPRGPKSSLLVRKPVPLDQGGAGHKGDDLYGGSVYATVDDPHFVVIYNWAIAATGGTQ